MRFILRFVGLLLLAGAFVALIVDGAYSIAGGALHITTLGETWFSIHQNSLLLLQPAVERHLAVWLWDPVIQTVLERPTWLVLGILGAFLVLLGRKKPPLIGYGRD